MRSLGQARLQYDWCPCNKRRLEHRQAQKKERVKAQEKAVCEPRRDLRTNQPRQHFNLGLLDSPIVRKYIL